jgi:hypothetical protein
VTFEFMGGHVQRKRLDLATEQAAEFAHPRWRAPVITLKATVGKISGEYWVYVAQEGHIISDNEPLLPDYEKVEAEQ